MTTTLPLPAAPSPESPPSANPWDATLKIMAAVILVAPWLELLWLLTHIHSS